MARKPTDPLLRQASDEAFLRYGPARDQLADLLRGAKRDRDQSLAASKGSLEGILRALQEAGPEMQKIYSGSAGTLSDSDALLRNDLMSLGSAADPYKGASLRENAAAHQRLAEASAIALKEVAERKVRAADGAALEQSGIQGRYQEQAGDVASKAEQLSREEGVFTSSRYGELRGDRAKRKVDYARIRSQNERDRLGRELARDKLTETQRHNKVQEQKKPKGTGKAKSPWLPKGQQNTIVGEINRITGLIRAAPRNLTTKQIRAKLHQDFDPKRVNVAMDLVFRKGLSPANVRYVHSQGVQVRGNFPILRKPRPSGGPTMQIGP